VDSLSLFFSASRFSVRSSPRRQYLDSSTSIPESVVRTLSEIKYGIVNIKKMASRIWAFLRLTVMKTDQGKSGRQSLVADFK